jgi:hypothetical protein
VRGKKKGRYFRKNLPAKEGATPHFLIFNRPLLLQPTGARASLSLSLSLSLFVFLGNASGAKSGRPSLSALLLLSGARGERSATRSLYLLNFPLKLSLLANFILFASSGN